MSAAHVDRQQVLSQDNVYLPEGAGKTASVALMGLGLLAIAGTFLAGLTGGKELAETALFAYHTGFLVVMGFMLGALVFVMIFHQTNAGFTATLRRQFENPMSLMPLGLLLFLVGVAMQWIFNSANGAYLFHWMDPAYVAGDVIYEKKKLFLNIPRFYISALIYFGVWITLSYFLFSFSTRQDTDGDKWLTAHARKLSAPGLLLFAFSASFAGFDWIMSLDYHWFSTMLGVYFFAGSAVSCMALVTLVLIILRTFGRLHVAFTDDHLHDLSKLLFAFTVFWAYISFSQYFLIWYANIPEETAFFLLRKQGVWEYFSWIIPICHFIIPFVFLMARTVRRSRPLIALACVWLLGIHVVDWYWMVRAGLMHDGEIVGPQFIDLFAIAGPVLVFAGLLVRKIASGPLMPLQDPRLDEGLNHKNYV